MGLILCEKQATMPYTVPESGKNIYSIEELCYYIYNNSYMLGKEFFSKELIDFVENGLSLESLAQKLKRGVDYGENFTNMIMYILDSCSYYDEEEKQGFAKTLDAIGSKSPAERIKARADVLMANKKYSSAVAVYTIILDQKEFAKQPDFLGDIQNNLGVAYVHMFLYEEAISCFKKAYDISQKEDYLDNMVCAAILLDDDSSMGEIMEKYSLTNETIEKYRKVIDFQTKQIAKSKIYRDTVARLAHSENTSLDLYNERIYQMLNEWKLQYRNQFI